MYGMRSPPPRRRGEGGSSQQRRVFDKLVKDGNATMDTAHQAQRFLEGMGSFESKAELLSKLEDKRNHGLQRVRQVLSFVNSLADIETLLLPLLKHIMTEETARPMMAPLRNKVLMTIYSVPNLLDTLVEREVIQIASKQSATYLCSYLLAIAQSFIKARTSEQVIELAKALRERGDIPGAHALCAVLLVDERDKKTEASTLNTGFLKRAPVASWNNDEVLPGGRHSNDHCNYRNIKIVPTANKLRCEEKSWLPLASGQKAIIEDPAIHLLDKNLRLVPPDCHMNHRCPNLCKEVCGPCKPQVGPIRLNCGHSCELVYCHDTLDEKAIDLLTKTCQQPVQHTFKICGHFLLTACTNANLPQPKCPGKCRKIIEKCGHACVGECGSYGDRVHWCGQLCKQNMFCGHVCGRLCHVGRVCPPCKQPCAVVCSHSHCPKCCHIPVSNLQHCYLTAKALSKD